MFGGFAAEQRTAGFRAGLGYALDDRSNAFWMDLSARYVVGHEQRFGTAYDKIVDDHSDQVETDGLVAIKSLGDGDLGADPIGRCRQHRMVALGERAGIEQAREAADAAHNLRT